MIRRNGRVRTASIVTKPRSRERPARNAANWFLPYIGLPCITTTVVFAEQLLLGLQFQLYLRWEGYLFSKKQTKTTIFYKYPYFYWFFVVIKGNYNVEKNARI
jgi:hypothetical protein